MLVVPARKSAKQLLPPNCFLKMADCYLLVGFGTRVHPDPSLTDAVSIATPKKRLPGAGGGFLTRR
jgi:hypothetical protein